jgi:E3 ubiquitin-protein ligase HUWE1
MLHVLTNLDENPAASALFGIPAARPTAQHSIEHPLLAAPPTIPTAPRTVPRGLGTLNDLLATLEGMGGSHAVHMLESVLARNGDFGNDAIRINVNHDDNGAIGLSIGGRSFNIPGTGHRPNPPASESPANGYIPKPTSLRWQEEMAIIPGPSSDQTAKLVVHVINRLLPEARRAAEEEASRLQKQEESASMIVDPAQVDGTNIEATKAPSPVPESQVELEGMREEPTLVTPQPPSEDTEMRTSSLQPSGSQTDKTFADEATAALDPAILVNAEVPPAESEGANAVAQRTVISIYGREVDITDTGIDLEFLQALPDEMRADVVEQHTREQNRVRRPATTSAPAPTSQLSAEFLDALPPDIRAEVIFQEAMENARLAVTTNRPAPVITNRTNQRSTSGAVEDPENNPPHAQVDEVARRGVNAVIPAARRASIKDLTQPSKRPRRDAVQLLDRAGVAALVRLLFIPEVLKQGHLFHILVNLCENSASRSDLLGILLSIVHDGTGDLLAVDKSFQQMTLRPMVTPKSTAKSKPVDSPAPAATSSMFAHLQSEYVATYITQRCFDALIHIVTINSRAATYFLSEQEELFGLRRASAKKGKGKERSIPQTKFPIVILLSLLDRRALLDGPGIMEALTGLLAAVTKPLAALKTPPQPIVQQTTPTGSDGLITATASASDDVATGSTVKPVPGPATSTSSSDIELSVAPVIPNAVLKLVANALTIGECSSKTFSQTLGLMHNLAHLTNVKTVILEDLQSRAQLLGETLREELRSLAEAIRDVPVDIGLFTAATFSPPSSSQAQLLRLLKTIEYLHLGKIDSDLSATATGKEEVAVKEIYASFHFEQLWRNLGDCLALVELQGRTEHIPTVLLPLVETLMVVCKFESSALRASRSPSAPPSTTDEAGDLFVEFTTTHRKVLNSIVRNNPALLSGSFALLVRNPRVLDFDNKRNWFFQRLKSKRDRTSSGMVSLNVRRKHVFEDSFKALQARTDEEIKYGKLNVKFQHEDGIDAGGVTREWYSILAQQIFDPNFGMFWDNCFYIF